MSAFNEFKNLMAEATAAQKKKIQDGSMVESEQIPEKSALDEFKNLIKEAAIIPKKEPKQIEEVVSIPLVEEESVAERTARFLSSSKKRDEVVENIEAQRWNDPLRRESNEKFVTFKEMNDHYTKLFGRLQQQMASIGGGGEVNFRNLDDVDRSTIGPNRHLAYNPTTKKFFFEDVLGGEPQVQSDWNESDTGDVAFIKNKPNPIVGDEYTTSIANNTISVINLPENTGIGPIDHLHFNLAHTHEEERLIGTLCWDNNDQTLNLTHPNGVTQQIGQETYAYVQNGTANTIPDGTVCMFIGATQPDGESRLLVGPSISDGTFPSLYTIGVATHDIEPGVDGRVTVFGKVRELDTSSFDVGDILYSDPNVAGGLTNIKPTAPDCVVPVAAVLRKGTTDGEIFVRPTIEQRKYYGRFSRSTDQTATDINEAIAVAFDTTEIANGISFNGGTDTQIIVSESGYYQFDLSAQVTATSNKGIVYFWFRKNGTDIPNSTRASTISNGDTFNISTTISISLAANDYVEIMWAKTAAGILLDAVPATSFAPSAAAVMLNVTQTQL